MNKFRMCVAVALITVATGVAGCGQQSSVANVTELKGTSWSGVRIAGDTIPPNAKITANFGLDGQMNGSAGCNRYFTAYKENQSKLTLGPIGATKKLCPELQMLAEKRFLAALGSANGWAMKDGNLILFGTGAELTFAKVQ